MGDDHVGAGGGADERVVLAAHVRQAERAHHELARARAVHGLPVQLLDVDALAAEVRRHGLEAQALAPHLEPVLLVADDRDLVAARLEREADGHHRMEVAERAERLQHGAHQRTSNSVALALVSNAWIAERGVRPSSASTASACSTASAAAPRGGRSSGRGSGRHLEVERRDVDERGGARQRVEVAGLLAAGHELLRLQEVHELVRDRAAVDATRADRDHGRRAERR
jgi:hypothetical protein